MSEEVKGILGRLHESRKTGSQESTGDKTPVSESVADVTPEEFCRALGMTLLDGADVFECPKCEVSYVLEDFDACPTCGSELAVAGEITFDEEEALTEALMKTVVRHGKKVKIKVKKKRFKPLSAAQKAALMKARRVAHTASAQTWRKKSQSVRKTISDGRQLTPEDIETMAEVMEEVKAPVGVREAFRRGDYDFVFRYLDSKDSK